MDRSAGNCRWPAITACPATTLLTTWPATFMKLSSGGRASTCVLAATAWATGRSGASSRAPGEAVQLVFVDDVGGDDPDEDHLADGYRAGFVQYHRQRVAGPGLVRLNRNQIG